MKITQDQTDHSKLARFLGYLFEIGFVSGAYKFLIDARIDGNYQEIIPKLFQLPYASGATLTLKKALTFQYILRVQSFPKTLFPGKNEKERLTFLQGIFTMSHIKGYDTLFNFFQSQNLQDYLPDKISKIKVIHFAANIFNVFNQDTQHSYENNVSQNIICESLDTYFKSDKRGLSAKDYNRKGEFVNADFFLIVDIYNRNRRKGKPLINRHYIVFDLTNHCLLHRNFADTPQDIESDITFYHQMVEDIQQTFYKFKSKSVWSNLNIDFLNQIHFVEHLQENQDLLPYFFIKDKEAGKIIQSSSYLYSLFDYMGQNDVDILFPEKESQYNGSIFKKSRVFISVLGISNIDQSGFTTELLAENQAKLIYFLKQAYNIYLLKENNSDINLETSKIKTKFENIYQNQFFNFDKQKFYKAIESLEEVPAKIVTIKKNIKIPDQHRLCLRLRQQHTEKIRDFFDTDIPILILSGNPGIGKTFSLFNTVKPKTLFLYCSPRLVVNSAAQKDFVEKLQSLSTNISEKKLGDRTNKRYSIITNRTLSNVGLCSCYCTKKAALYTKIEALSKALQQRTENNVQKKIFKQDIDDTDHNNLGLIYADEDFKDIYTSRETLRCIPTGDKSSNLAIAGTSHYGVIENLCNQIFCFSQRDIEIDGLLAGFAMQAAKNLQDTSRSSFNHIKRLLGDHNLNFLKTKFDHIVVMIDEITGNENGSLLFNHFKNFFFNTQDTKLKDLFDLRLIVADASIVNDEIMDHYLGSEEDAAKIYYKKKKQNNVHNINTKGIECLDKLSENDNISKRVINVNSYPASYLNISYQYVLSIINALEYQRASEHGQSLLGPEFKDHKEKLNNILYLILKHIDQQQNKSEEDKRIILLFLQNKEEIYKIKKILEKNICSFILELTSDTIKKNKIKKIIKNQFKNEQEHLCDVILTTSTATRGITIPKIDEYIFDIPLFNIEQNLMEIIQGLYRGRGWAETEGIYDQNTQTIIGGEGKKITFILTAKIFESQTNNEGYHKIKKNHYDDIIAKLYAQTLLLQGCFDTRIFGQSSYITNGQLTEILFVPIGEKKDDFKIYTTPYETLFNLKKEFRKELYKKHPTDDEQKLWQTIIYLLDSVFSGTTICEQAPQSILDSYMFSLFDYRNQSKLYSFFVNKSSILSDLYFTNGRTPFVNGGIQTIGLTIKEQTEIFGASQQEITDLLSYLEQFYDQDNKKMKQSKYFKMLKYCEIFHNVLKDLSLRNINFMHEQTHSVTQRRIAIPLSYLYTNDMIKATQYFNQNQNAGWKLYLLLDSLLNIFNERCSSTIVPTFISHSQYTQCYFLMYPTIKSHIRNQVNKLIPKNKIKLSNENNLLFLL